MKNAPRRYAKVIAKLEALPSKRLIAHRYYHRGDVCAIGALLQDPRTLQSDDCVARIASGSADVARALADAGLSIDEADVLQEFNDGFFVSKRARYAAVLARLRTGDRLESAL